MIAATRSYACKDERRRAALMKHAELVGMDYLEVSEDQRRLSIYFVPADESTPDKQAVPEGLGTRHFQITGGVRITDVRVTGVEYEGDESDPVGLVVTVTDGNSGDGVGDFSPYTLRLVGVPNVDPLFSQVTFSFKAERSGDFDCRPDVTHPDDLLPEPEIDYLAKDYASFRRLVLDRLSVLIPDWQERNPADLQIALVELLAYVGDYLSYQQDSIATEAYLGTARRRVSVRRHARLVDYFVHEGSNARVWAQVRVKGDGAQLRRGTQMITRVPNLPEKTSPGSAHAATALSSGAVVFETMHDATLYEAHNELELYTWGNEECCLPRGTTQATLKGNVPTLAPGDVLILEEVRGPETGEEGDADPAHRHPVRLTAVIPDQRDPLFGETITEIEWATADALPFPLCVSARRDNSYFENVSVARGNIVLADHGKTVFDEFVGTVPTTPPLLRVGPDNQADDRPSQPIFPRFRPRLRERPLTHAAPYGPPASASAVMNWSARDLLPAITLFADGVATWTARQDLLASEGSDTHFVVEIEEDGSAHLRFGDGRFGLRPTPGTAFTATYRVGNGVAGNVGAEALAHLVTDDPDVVDHQPVRNLLPAAGGTEPESIEQVRQYAPNAFRTQERAVTPEDYAEIAERHPEVQRAAATVRWTGSWRTVFLTIDRLGGRDVDTAFEEEMRRHLEPYRMVGYDLEIDGPRYVPLEIEMLARIRPDYFRSDMRTALLEVLSNRPLSDGRRGVFHPDNFTFGQAIYLSPLYSVAQTLEGVASVEVTRFQRQGMDGRAALEEGLLPLERLEVARLDNDPNFPEYGTFNLILEGGK